MAEWEVPASDLPERAAATTTILLSLSENSSGSAQSPRGKPQQHSGAVNRKPQKGGKDAFILPAQLILQASPPQRQRELLALGSAPQQRKESRGAASFPRLGRHHRKKNCSGCAPPRGWRGWDSWPGLAERKSRRQDEGRAEEETAVPSGLPIGGPQPLRSPFRRRQLPAASFTDGPPVDGPTEDARRFLRRADQRPAQRPHAPCGPTPARLSGRGACARAPSPARVPAAASATAQARAGHAHGQGYAPRRPLQQHRRTRPSLLDAEAPLTPQHLLQPLRILRSSRHQAPCSCQRRGPQLSKPRRPRSCHVSPHGVPHTTGPNAPAPAREGVSFMKSVQNVWKR